ncbi:MAG: hypothetical protein ACTSXW_03970 [Candidatus Baldrarchaeia archaeon]
MVAAHNSGKKPKIKSKQRTMLVLFGLNMVTLALLVSLKGFIFDQSTSATKIIIVELALLPSLISPVSFLIIFLILILAILRFPASIGPQFILISWIITFPFYVIKKRLTAAPLEVDELLQLETKLSGHGYTINEIEEKIVESLKANEIVHIYSISSTTGVDQNLLTQVVQKMLKEGKIQCLITTDKQKLIPLTVLKKDILKELETGGNPSITELSKKLGVEDKILIEALISLVKTGQFENYFRKYS